MAAPSSGSLLRHHVRDRRYRLTMPRAAALQFLHPAITAGAAEHGSRSRAWNGSSAVAGVRGSPGRGRREGCAGRGVGVAAGQEREGVLELGRADDLDVGVEPADGGGEGGP